MPPKQSQDWRKWLPTLDPDIELRQPAIESSIDAAEAALNLKFPDDLKNLLLATDGVVGSFKYWLVWPTAKIVEQNHHYRSFADFKSLYMPFDNLLFIGEVGNGDLFAYPIMASGSAQEKNDIFRWRHESDDRIWI